MVRRESAHSMYGDVGGERHNQSECGSESPPSFPREIAQKPSTPTRAQYLRLGGVSRGVDASGLKCVHNRPLGLMQLRGAGVSWCALAGGRGDHMCYMLYCW